MKPEKDLEFILGLSGFFVLVFLLLNAKFLLIIPALLVMISMVSEKATGAIAAVSRKGMDWLRDLTVRFVLSLFFLFVLLPIAVTQRLIGRD
ncbi:MAG: hypothetical protein ACLFPE_00300 [Bacteroidales bacterium]